MGHAYDTGLSTPQRTAIRRAFAARLASLAKTSNPSRYLRAIVHLPRTCRGEGDDRGMDMLLRALNGRSPSVAIALGRSSYQPEGDDPSELVGDLDIVVYVASSQGHDVVEGRLMPGPATANQLDADPGIDAMLEHVRERIAGQKLGIDSVQRPTLLEEDEVITLADLTVFEQRYRVRFETRINRLRSETRVVTSIQTKTELDGIPQGEPNLDPLIDSIVDLPPE